MTSILWASNGVGPLISNTLGLQLKVSVYPEAFTEVKPSITASEIADNTEVPFDFGT